MSDVAIRIDGLGKKYLIGGKQKQNNRLGDQVVEMVLSPFRRTGRMLRGEVNAASELDQEFWALQDISFEIKHGEIIGVIGHNGAGKSTLLKILSKITEPTVGYVDIFGRVGSLLEVGTGFHPELTGRENVYLNGSILGMRRIEIDRKFDEIVDFAEIEKFIDTPVKHYSSGMYVRLAFSVAAHLEPEILVIDEVLAVGDVAFQKKSLGKMENVSQQGRTVIFVSHNMNALQRLCPKSVLLDHGKLVMQDDTADVIENYLSNAASKSQGPNSLINIVDQPRQGTGKVRFTSMTYSSDCQQAGNFPFTDGPLEFELNLHSDLDRSIGSVAVTIFDRYGTSLVNMDTLSLGMPIRLKEGLNKIKLKTDELHLNPGMYTVGLWAADPPFEMYDALPSVALIEIAETERKNVRVKSDGLVSVKFHIEDNS
jgi:lipopolysaccharide transport system ATP-binding protein